MRTYSHAKRAALEDLRKAVAHPCSTCGLVRTFKQVLRPDDAGVTRAVSVCSSCGSLLVVPFAPLRGDVSTSAATSTSIKSRVQVLPRIPHDSFGSLLRSAPSPESALIDAALAKVDAFLEQPEWRWAP